MKQLYEVKNSTRYNRDIRRDIRWDVSANCLYPFGLKYRRRTRE